MNADMRRKEIVRLLEGATAPLAAAKIADELGVTRQVIVQDVALLRAAGIHIVSHARGYVIERSVTCQRAFKVHHNDEDVERELNLIVDLGGTVEDVFIFHKAYGTIRAHMGIRSRLNVKQFIEKIRSGKSSLLKNVTSGYHYHTVVADSEETLELIAQSLKEGGFLAPLQEYEPKEIN